MDIRKKLGFAVLALGVGLVGCGDDGGGDTDMDAGNGGDGFADLPPAKVMDGAADPDYSCLGSATSPAPGDSVDFTIVFEEFAGMGAVGEICFSFYGDNTIPMSDSCAGSGQMATISGTDPSASTAMVTDADAAWYGYRIYPDANNVGVIQKNEPAPAAGGETTGNAVSTTTAGLIPGILGLSRDMADALFSGQVFDCNGDAVEGAAFRVVKDGTAVEEGAAATDAHYEYFDGSEFPMAGRSFTNTDGLFLGVNIPVTTEGEPAQLVACANIGGTPTLIGCEETRSFANNINIVNLGPVRSDGPVCPDICSQ